MRKVKFDESNFTFDFAVGAETGHVINGDKDALARPGGDDRGIFNERIAREQRRLEAGGHLERREALFSGQSG